MARPTVMTDEVVQKLEYAFALGCSDEEACFYADIAKQTLYNYQEKTEGFLDRKEALKSRPIFLARETLIKGIQRDPDLALKMLERKNKAEFSLRQELTGRDGENIGVTISAKQAEQLIRARAERTDS